MQTLVIRQENYLRSSLHRHSGLLFAGLWLWLAPLTALCRGQQPTPEDAVIDTIRTQAQVSESDQRRIEDWVEAQIDRLKQAPENQRLQAANQMRDKFRVQFENPANSAAFKAQLAGKTAAVASAQYGALDPKTAQSLGKVLLDYNRPEAIPAFVVGLKSKDDGVRLLSATGLAHQRAAVAADKNLLDQAVGALREAGLSETSPAVLGRIYWALAMPPPQATAALEAYSSILARRLESRRAGATAADGAEIDAFEFFRTPGVLSAMNQQQKEQLARLVAGFLRVDAQRYAASGLDFEETDRLQRLLDGEEEILEALVGAGKGGKVRDALAAGQSAEQVRQQAILWVGDSASDQQGALNSAPWNVPVGAEK